METVVFQRGVTPVNVEDIQIGPGRYKAYLELPDVPLLQWWYDHTYKPAYHAIIFGADRKVTLDVPIEVEGQTRMKKVTVWEPAIVGNRFVIEFAIAEDPAAWVIVIGIGVGALAVAVMLDKLTRLTDASGFGDVVKGIGASLKTVSGPLGVLLIIMAALGIIAFLPSAVKSGKGAAKQLGLK
jgi:hypothetical protein